MEYEIDFEDRLMDDSTNPSLKTERGEIEEPVRRQSTVKPEDYPAEDRRLQTAVSIPEEEYDQQMR